MRSWLCPGDSIKQREITREKGELPPIANCKLLLRRSAVPSLQRRGLKFIDLAARRRRAWTLAGGTRALFSAYHRNNESKRTAPCKGDEDSSHPVGVRALLVSDNRGLRSLTLANPRLISWHASGVR